jgi:hypothetical protein
MPLIPNRNRAVRCFNLGKPIYRRFRSYGEKHGPYLPQLETSNCPANRKEEPNRIALGPVGVLWYAIDPDCSRVDCAN